MIDFNQAQAEEPTLSEFLQQLSLYSEQDGLRDSDDPIEVLGAGGNWDAALEVLDAGRDIPTPVL